MIIQIINYLFYFFVHSKKLSSEIYANPLNQFKYRNEFMFSLTTSPLRLSKLHFVFNNLPSNIPIILNLPIKFKNVEDYNLNELSKLQSQFKNVVVNWLQYDMGPQTKVLGLFYAKNNLKEFFKNKTVIIIDDDTKYPNSIVKIYDEYHEKYSSFSKKICVFSSSLPITYGIPLVEGFGSYSFKFNEIVHEKFVNSCSKYSSLDGCKMHDDFVFSAAFQDLDYIPIKVDNLITVQLPYGYDSDSLHFQEPNVVKSKICSINIWNERRQCRVFE